MSLLIGSMTIGFILSLLALGVFLSFRVFAFPDITAEGSITLGASVSAALLVAGFSPFSATMAGFLSGMIAGAATGILHTRFSINGLLAGILVMTSLYSINLHIMGKSNIPFSPRPLSRILLRRPERSSSADAIH
jgi:putative ABC transport system permease protein